ncbi:unnamed protein product [Urochloa humidicola]
MDVWIGGLHTKITTGLTQYRCRKIIGSPGLEKKTTDVEESSSHRPRLPPPLTHCSVAARSSHALARLGSGHRGLHRQPHLSSSLPASANLLSSPRASSSLPVPGLPPQASSTPELSSVAVVDLSCAPCLAGHGSAHKLLTFPCSGVFSPDAARWTAACPPVPCTSHPWC